MGGRQVEEIHTIFSELGTLVASQAEAVENVTTAVALTYHSTDSALAEIQRYEAAQSKGGCVVQ